MVKRRGHILVLTATIAIASLAFTGTYNYAGEIKLEEYTYSQINQPQVQYTYTQNQESTPTAYTYAVQPSNENSGGYNYEAVVNGGQGDGYYTYTTNAAQGGQGLTYTAEPAPEQMTVINGYATEPQEKWNTIPVGTLHPLDTAGKWESGTFDSINPDGSSRVMAPLTLSGEREDGAVASEARRKPSVGLKGRARAQFSSLAELGSSTVFSVPISKVVNLSTEDQKRWANHVLQMRRRQEIFSASPKQVLTMTPAEQKLWAQHTLRAYRNQLLAKQSRQGKRWASQVEKLMHLHKVAAHNRKSTGAHPHGATRASKPSAVPPVSHKAVTRKATVFDGFGFPELKSPSPNVAQIQTRLQITRSLQSHRRCDASCLKLARMLAQDQLPV
uniref:Uncharacterized protein n=1 Tax=Cryptomonas curvata TaxID=233186 RepID=A0A7S0MMI8_9CRYP|mmetsp:Transcript_48554/g.101459  ORF Transcript_48554/g.101459 Transcript_48554/m.101459 type:complete len:387 (+) Transcript_48554:1-1161(+)